MVGKFEEKPSSINGPVSFGITFEKLCPPFVIDDFLDLLTKSLGILRIFGQVIKGVGEGLHDVFQVTHTSELGGGV